MLLFMPANAAQYAVTRIPDMEIAPISTVSGTARYAELRGALSVYGSAVCLCEFMSPTFKAASAIAGAAGRSLETPGGDSGIKAAMAVLRPIAKKRALGLLSARNHSLILGQLVFFSDGRHTIALHISPDGSARATRFRSISEPAKGRKRIWEKLGGLLTEIVFVGDKLQGPATTLQLLNRTFDAQEVMNVLSDKRVMRSAWWAARVPR
jgi:hypothetical protein